MAANDDETTRRPVRDGIDKAGRHANEAASSAHAAGRATLERTRDGLHDARERAASAYSAASERAGDAYAAARDRASGASDRASAAIDGNPIAAVLGGVALGIVIGALLPRTRKEAELYGAIGTRLTDAAREAASAARDAGREKLGDLGLSRENAGTAVRSVLDAAIAAAGSRAAPDGEPHRQTAAEG